MKASFLLYLILFSGIVFSQSYSKCKIFTDDSGLTKLSKLGVTIDHGIYKKNTFYINDFSNEEIDLIRNAGFELEMLIPDVKQFYVSRNKTESIVRNGGCGNSDYTAPKIPVNFNLGSMAGFLTYQEMLDELDQMAALYPNLITIKQPISTFLTHESRPIHWVRLSDQANTDEDEPEILYSAIHHAREPLSLSSTIFYMWYLLENYATNPEIKFLVDETEMYFVPMINPDGYIHNQTTDPSGGGMWRKNKRNNNDGTFGVDLNRNYSHGWGTTGISMSTGSDVYPGTAAFSEPETKAIKWFCENRDFLFAFNAHTYSNLILFPIGSSVTEIAADNDYFQNISNTMVQYSGFIAEKASSLYEASGDSDDYMYLEDLLVKPKIFAFTPEIGSGTDGFWPIADNIIPLSQAMIHSNLVMAYGSHNYWTVSDIDPNSIETVSGNFNHHALRLGLDESDLTVSIIPLLGIAQIGPEKTHDLAINMEEDGAIHYDLNADIKPGDEIKYVLVTNLNGLLQYDTIIKIFGNPALQFSDNATNGNNWTGNWNTTNLEYYSASNSFTDSPGTNYTNNSSQTYQLNQTIDLVNALNAKISFYAKWDIEAKFDFARLEISTDNGNSWIGQCGKYTSNGTSASGSVQPNNEPVYDGLQAAWVLEEINLSDYLGQSILLRFNFQSDGGSIADGFYFDDFKIYYTNKTNSLEKLDANLGFNVFPSPAQNQLTISNPSSMQGLVIAIYDCHGRKVFTDYVQHNVNNYHLNISHLENGIYYTELINKELQKTQIKILIQK